MRIENHISIWLSQEAWVALRCRKTRWCASRNSSVAAVAWVARSSTMQCSSRCAGTWDSNSAKNATKFCERVESVGATVTLPVAHSNAANSALVPWRRYSNSCPAPRPTGRDAPAANAGWVGLMRLLACIPVFSSTLNTAQCSSGARYSAHMSTALSSKSRSWEVIGDRTCHGLRLIDWQLRHTCESEIAIPWRSRNSRAASGIDMRALRRRPPRWPGPAGRVVIVLTSANLSWGP